MSATRSWSPRPTGLGTSAALIGVPRPADDPFPDLYCPEPIRDDEALGRLVNHRLAAWLRQFGFGDEVIERFEAYDFGRFAMLAHPDTDDADRLMATAAWTATLTILDDHYVDDEQMGAAAALLGERLTLAAIAIDPGHLPDPYHDELLQAVDADPILASLGAAVDLLGRYGTPGQLGRIRFENLGFFMGTTAEMTWRATGAMPPVWRYLAVRQVNSFLPCITTCDLVGGYHIPDEVYHQPKVRRAVKLLALTTVIVNDLYSMAKESAQDSADGGLPVVVAAERGCPMPEAVAISVEIHNEVMRAFEAECRELLLLAHPALHRFLAGIHAWAGGCRAWHRDSVRFQVRS